MVVDRCWTGGSYLARKRSWALSMQSSWSAAWLFALITRATAYPYCLTVYSRRQGVGKGDTLKAIANGQHSWLDEHLFVGQEVEKRVREKGRGKSILEVSEREGLSPRGQAALKSFVTMEDTHLRDSYGRVQNHRVCQLHPRCNVQ